MFSSWGSGVDCSFGQIDRVLGDFWASYDLNDNCPRHTFLLIALEAYHLFPVHLLFSLLIQQQQGTLARSRPSKKNHSCIVVVLVVESSASFLAE